MFLFLIGQDHCFIALEIRIFTLIRFICVSGWFWWFYGILLWRSKGKTLFHIMHWHWISWLIFFRHSFAWTNWIYTLFTWYTVYRFCLLITPLSTTTAFFAHTFNLLQQFYFCLDTLWYRVIMMIFQWLNFVKVNFLHFIK